MLCGISTSFPVLSPNRRQVAHALLTRPPLIRTRRFFTVRLECVMHAASVHPEPGSNSLKNCISISVSTECYQLIRVICLLNYLLELLRTCFTKSIKFKRIFGVSCTLLFKLVHMIVVQFSMSFCFACCLSAACLLYHIRFRLSRGFSNFFQVFFADPFGSAPRLSAACILYHKRFALSRGFSNFFEVFSTSFSFVLLSRGQL